MLRVKICLQRFLKRNRRFFSAEKTIERALSYWGREQISYAMERIQHAVLESRKNPLLGEAIIRQALLRLAIVARRQMTALKY